MNNTHIAVVHVEGGEVNEMKLFVGPRDWAHQSAHMTLKTAFIEAFPEDEERMKEMTLTGWFRYGENCSVQIVEPEVENYL